MHKLLMKAFGDQLFHTLSGLELILFALMWVFFINKCTNVFGYLPESWTVSYKYAIFCPLLAHCMYAKQIKSAQSHP